MWLGKKRSALVFISAGLLSLIITLGVYLRSKAEPVYRGKRLSLWVQQAPPRRPDTMHDDNPAKEAVFHLGAQAVPDLGKLMERKDSKFQDAYNQAYRKLPSFINNHLPSPVYPRAIRREAARLLGDLVNAPAVPASAFEPAIPILIRAASGADSDLSGAAFWTLTAIAKRPTNSTALDALIVALDSPNPALRTHSTRAFTDPELRTRRALPKLKKKMEDPAPGLRIDAALAVFRIAEEADGPVQVLIRELKGTSPTDRGNAANHLYEIGPPARVAVTALEETTHDPDQYPRDWAKRALQKIDPDQFSEEKAGVSTLMDRLKSVDPHERQNAARMLEQLGDSAKPAIKSLWEVLNGPDPENAWVFAQAIWMIDNEQAPALVAPMISYLRNGDMMNRHAAGQLLGRMGVKDSAAIMALRDGLADKNQWVREASAFGVLKLKGVSEQTEETAWTILLAVLKSSPDFSARFNSALYLGWLGPAAKKSVPALQVALGDPHPMVRKAVQEALEKIRRD